MIIGSLSVSLQSGTAEAASSGRSVAPIPNKLGNNEIVNVLKAVSCTSSTFCVAVGYFYDGKTDQTLIESWNGTDWSAPSSPDQSSGANELEGVSCTSWTYCVAVGNYYETSDTQQILVEAWNGADWSIVSTPDPSTSYDVLSGVSCPSSSNCVAVGTSSAGALVESWGGTAWSVVPNPDSDSGGTLDGVSCTGTTSCQAVGAFGSGSLVESWNGTAWSVSSFPDSGSYSNGLEGVSCASSTDCVAVGYFKAYSYSSEAQLLSGSWDGTTWSNTSPFSDDSDFAGVSCTGSIYCVAVGTGYDGYGDTNVIEIWNGTAWSNSPNSPGATGLAGVSCLSASNCFAVGIKGGYRGEPINTEIASWNGTNWAPVKSPDPVTITKFNPISGPPGTTVVIRGANLERASAVTFNGVPAGIVNDRANKMTVTVPSGATTGVIQVMTRHGTGISSSSFTVT